MALNKYMHPRNIYKTPPDFAELARSYEEFSRIAKTDVTGKVTIDFKNPNSLRILTKFLLKSDFGLDVDIPEDRLVPTLPLRLNYILWIEDLLNAVGRNENIKGLDIGTGACVVYPLLGAVKNKWHMVGTETDQESFLKAQENVKRNKLQDLIKLSKNPTTSLIEYLYADENAQTFDFCMCNPPFYSNVQELCESRSPARLPPKNAFTGSPQELITEGGELTFCRKMIEESKIYRDKVLIFTTMVGHKYNLKELVQDLKAEGINHTSTEFCQGRVTRWGLAWTFQEFDICKLVPARDKPRKKDDPMIYLLQNRPDSLYNMDEVAKKLMSILQDLNINFKILNKRGNNLSLKIKAMENTWSNQRRKRRLRKQLNEHEAKKPKLEKSSDILDGETQINTNITSLEYKESNPGDSKELTTLNSEDKVEVDGINSDNNHNTVNDEPIDAKMTTDTTSNEKESNGSTESVFSGMETDTVAEGVALVHAFIKLLKKDEHIILQMEFLGGTAGKEGLHQIMQFIKNNWKYLLFHASYYS